MNNNSIGFEQADAERIFNVFTRLYGNVEYSGVELSIAPRWWEATVAISGPKVHHKTRPSKCCYQLLKHTPHIEKAEQASM